MFRFVKLKEEHLTQVLQWRIKPEVSKFLFTKISNDMEKQLQWFKRIDADPRYKYWLIEYQGQNIGVINLSEYDLTNKRCNAGFYIGETQFNYLGGAVLPYIYNYVFNDLKLNKIYGEVVEGNQILKIHLLHGYTHVGTFHDHIVIDDQFHNVHLVELLSKNWNKMKRYKSYIAEFEN